MDHEPDVDFDHRLRMPSGRGSSTRSLRSRCPVAQNRRLRGAAEIS